MMSVANRAQFVPQIGSILLLPQPLNAYKATTNTTTTTTTSKMSSTSTPPLTILEPATPPQSQPEDLQLPTAGATATATAAAAAAAVSRLTDFSIAAILGNSAITSTMSSAICSHQTFTATQNSPVASNTRLHIETNEQSGTNQPISQENISHQQQKQVSCKRIRPKKYQCPYCWVALSNTGQFKGHIRIHTGERPFICECGKSFTRNEELTRHKRIHTGLRPYSCPICNKCFGRKDHLKKHTRTHEKGADKLDESSANVVENASTTNTAGGATGGGAIGSSGSSSTSGSSISNYSDHSALSSPHQQMAPTNFDISGYLSAMNLFSNMMANTPRYSY